MASNLIIPCYDFKVVLEFHFCRSSWKMHVMNKVLPKSGVEASNIISEKVPSDSMFGFPHFTDK